MPRLLIATKNAHKTEEIRAILGGTWEVSDLTAHPEVPSPEETGVTFEENARIKAEAASLVFLGIVLSDDSGLEVDALGGEPGVQSALYAGTHGDNAGNRARLKRELLALRKSGTVDGAFPVRDGGRAGRSHGGGLRRARGGPCDCGGTWDRGLRI